MSSDNIERRRLRTPPVRTPANDDTYTEPTNSEESRKKKKGAWKTPLEWAKEKFSSKEETNPVKRTRSNSESEGSSQFTRFIDFQRRDHSFIRRFWTRITTIYQPRRLKTWQYILLAALLIIGMGLMIVFAPYMLAAFPVLIPLAFWIKATFATVGIALTQVPIAITLRSAGRSWLQVGAAVAFGIAASLFMAAIIYPLQALWQLLPALGDPAVAGLVYVSTAFVSAAIYLANEFAPKCGMLMRKWTAIASGKHVKISGPTLQKQVEDPHQQVFRNNQLYSNKDLQPQETFDLNWGIMKGDVVIASGTIKSPNFPPAVVIAVNDTAEALSPVDYDLNNNDRAESDSYILVVGNISDQKRVYKLESVQQLVCIDGAPVYNLQPSLAALVAANRYKTNEGDNGVNKDNTDKGNTKPAPSAGLQQSGLLEELPITTQTAPILPTGPQ